VGGRGEVGKVRRSRYVTVGGAPIEMGKGSLTCFLDFADHGWL